GSRLSSGTTTVSTTRSCSLIMIAVPFQQPRGLHAASTIEVNAVRKSIGDRFGNECPRILDEEGETKWITEKRLESVSLIEAPCPFVLCVHDYCTQSGNVGGSQRPQKGVAQEFAAEMATLKAPIDC